MRAVLRWIRRPTITIATLLAAAASPAQAPGTHWDAAGKAGAPTVPVPHRAPLLLLVLGVAALIGARRPHGSRDD